jgi:hypothetical protein
MPYLVTSDPKLLDLIDSNRTFAFLHYFRTTTPKWAFDALIKPVVVEVQFRKSYDATDTIKVDDIELIGKTQYVYHWSNRKIFIYKAYKDPTYLVLLDFVRYSSYKSVKEWVDDFCDKISNKQYFSITYLCKSYGKRRPHRNRKRHVFLFVGEKI